MCNLIFFLFGSFRSLFQSRLRLQAEVIALRHQVTVLRRSQRGRVRLRASDRVFWVWLSRLWSGWRSALTIVKPETVISWHRKGFRLYWAWKSGRRTPGRPEVSEEVRDLVRKMSKANPLWGAPRIHGELLKIGIEVSQATVAKYMGRQRKPPSQTWRTFLQNHGSSWSRRTSSSCRPSLFEFYMSLSSWRTIGGACSISRLPPIPLRNGQRNSWLRRSLGATHRATYSTIATRFMKGHSVSEFEGWRLRKF